MPPALTSATWWHQPESLFLCFLFHRPRELSLLFPRWSACPAAGLPRLGAGGRCPCLLASLPFQGPLQSASTPPALFPRPEPSHRSRLGLSFPHALCCLLGSSSRRRCWRLSSPFVSGPLASFGSIRLHFYFGMFEPFFFAVSWVAVPKSKYINICCLPCTLLIL